MVARSLNFLRNAISNNPHGPVESQGVLCGLRFDGAFSGVCSDLMVVRKVRHPRKIGPILLLILRQIKHTPAIVSYGVQALRVDADLRGVDFELVVEYDRAAKSVRRLAFDFQNFKLTSAKSSCNLLNSDSRGTSLP